MRVSVLQKLFLAVALILPLAAAPAMAAEEGPDREEGLMDDARIRTFGEFFPVQPEGWVRDQDPDIFLSEEASTISYTYLSLTEGGVGFTITITFSNTIASQYKKMLRRKEERATWGFDKTEIADWDALTSKERGVGEADFVVVVSNSRSVSIIPSSNIPLPPIADITRIFGALNFDGIAAKN